MATSGVTTYSVTELDVIEAAAAKLGIKQTGQTMNPADVVLMRVGLNMIYKQWIAQADFAPGLKMWARRRAYLFLSDAVEYHIGPTGDECAAEEYVAMTLNGGAAAAATTVTVDDATGAVAAMRIGVQMADSLHWTTIASVAGNDITLTAALTGAAADGASAFAYTSKPVKPFEITSASLRNLDDEDSPMDPHLSADEYEQIPSKHGIGTPFRLYQEAKKDGMRVYLDCVPEDLTKVVRLVYHSYIEDTTAQSQDVDFPAEWFRALVGQLAVDSAPDFSRPITPELKEFRNDGLRMARNAHPEKSTAAYQADWDSY
jgi:hypothetical protein